MEGERKVVRERDEKRRDEERKRGIGAREGSEEGRQEKDGSSASIGLRFVSCHIATPFYGW